MSKIGNIGTAGKANLVETQQRREQETASTKNTAGQSVISSIRPEITEAGEAMAVLSNILTTAKNDPEKAVSAQGPLNESRVKALLED